MPVSVIDLLEPVDIDKGHAEPLASRFRPVDRGGEFGLESETVLQPSGHVRMRNLQSGLLL